MSTTQTRTPELTRTQRITVEGARELLAEDHAYDSATMAMRCGSLEYVVRSLLETIADLTGEEK